MSSSSSGATFARFCGPGRRLSERLVRDSLFAADIIVGGDRPWDPQVHNSRFYGRVALNGSLGLGESYAEGWWDVEALDDFFERLVAAQGIRRTPFVNDFLLSARSHLLNLQTESRAFRVAETHYDLGNDLFRAMLDPLMIYTCADWHGVGSLEAAQEAKLDAICRKLQLEPGMRLLDIGCGWGGLAKFAAERYSVSVVGVTVSREQLRFGRALCSELPVELLLLDYRNVEGTFDAVTSIEMLEAVGHKNYRRYMRQVAHCLERTGRFVLQTIGRNHGGSSVDPWIQKYIFPNGEVPSIRQITAATEGLMVVEHVENLGANYPPTLKAWFRNFKKACPYLPTHYTGEFYRMWQYYLLCCAGAFRAKHLQLYRCTLSRGR